MRDAAIAVIREIGVEPVARTSSLPWSAQRTHGRLEMNARFAFIALASKATGPIECGKLAVGYTLDEIDNDITRKTPACFSDSGYVVEIQKQNSKFPQAKAAL